MDTDRIDAILTACEQALNQQWEVDLKKLGFWRAVEAVKRRPELIERYADRIAAIDRKVFERSDLLPLSPAVGATVLVGASVSGVLLALAANRLPQRWRGFAALASLGALLVGTHDLAHLVVGKLTGTSFSHWFLGSPTRPQPGLKIDYASYLRTPPRARAWMHASGALVTKLVPFLVLGATAGARLPRWTVALLLGVGGMQIATDVLLSTRYSDWKRFRREMRVARDLGN